MFDRFGPDASQKSRIIPIRQENPPIGGFFLPDDFYSFNNKGHQTVFATAQNSGTIRALPAIRPVKPKMRE